MTATKENEADKQQRLAEGINVLDARRKPENLEELAHYIRRTLPQSNNNMSLELNAAAGAIQCRWHTREFIVKPSLEVFELRGLSLFVTGASILLQSVLAKQRKNARVFDEVVLSILKAEELLQRSRTETALALLKLVKRTMRKQFWSRSNQSRMNENADPEKTIAPSNGAPSN